MLAKMFGHLWKVFVLTDTMSVLQRLQDEPGTHLLHELIQAASLLFACRGEAGAVGPQLQLVADMHTHPVAQPQ